MIDKKLELIFLTEDKKKFTVPVDNPKSDLDSLEVEESMNTIIENNIFTLSGSEIKEIHKARIVTRLVEDII